MGPCFEGDLYWLYKDSELGALTRRPRDLHWNKRIHALVVPTHCVLGRASRAMKQAFCLGDTRTNGHAQNALNNVIRRKPYILIKEYTLNRIRDPSIV